MKKLLFHIIIYIFVKLLINYEIVNCQCSPGYGYRYTGPEPPRWICEKCAIGRYSTGGDSACLDCLAGTYCPIAGTVTPTKCPTGTQQPNRQAIQLSQCTKCVPGKYANNTGTVNCYECPPGQYCNKIGTINPIDCPKGFYRYINSQINCNPCEPGWYANKTKSITCSLCEPGYYCSNPANNPVECPPGKNSYGGQTTCTDCPNGWYTDKPKSMFCFPCPPGSYCPKKSSQPIKCPRGKYSPGGLTECFRCPCGKYTNTEGSITCLTCPTKFECLNPASDPVPCSTCTSPTEYASDFEIISTSIIKEVGYGKINDAYNALAWIIYNRMHNPICGGTVNPYPTNAKDNLLREEKDGSIKQFEVNAPYKGLGGCIKRSDIFLHPQGYPVDTKSPSYAYSSQLALNLLLDKPPSLKDPTGTKIFFGDLTYKSKYPDGIELGGNWFYDTKGSLDCTSKPSG